MQLQILNNYRETFVIQMFQSCLKSSFENERKITCYVEETIFYARNSICTFLAVLSLAEKFDSLTETNVNDWKICNRKSINSEFLNCTPIIVDDQLHMNLSSHDGINK